MILVLALFAVAVLVLLLSPVISYVCHLASKWTKNDKLPRWPWAESIASLWRQISKRALSNGCNWIQRKLCLKIFSGLFTSHIIGRAQARSNMESSPVILIVFLNRNVQDNSVILLCFSVMSGIILLASALAFLNSIPLVTAGTDYLGGDSNSQSLICYTHECYSIDYTNLTYQNEANITMSCYVWSLNIFGVACAATVSIFKLAVLITTIYVQAGELLLKVFKNRKRIINFCKWIAMIILGVIAGISVGIAIYNVYVIATGRDLSTMVKECAGYLYLPMWLCLGLSLVTLNLEAHCKQPEYNTSSPDPSPQRER